MPEALVVTATVILHEALAASVPPLKEMVRGAVVESVPPHCDDDPVETLKPLGNVSVKAIPLRDKALLGLVNVNVNVEFAPAATGLGEKDLLRVAEEGAPHPVNLMLSRLRSAPLLGVLAPVP